MVRLSRIVVGKRKYVYGNKVLGENIKVLKKDKISRKYITVMFVVYTCNLVSLWQANLEYDGIGM
jgi:hypothetical protein